MHTFRALCATGVAAAIFAAGCGSSSKSTSTTATSAQASVTGTITVLAASSLTAPFTAFGHDFEAANPGTKVSFSFGSSADLENSIEQGAPGDVFASADQKNMDKLVAAGENAGPPVNFAKNKLEIAVEKGNPKHITTLSDLTKSGTVVVLCDPKAPCGKFAAQVLDNAKVDLTPKSLEANAKATLSKVELGEADAAVVYVSDIASSATVDGVEIPDSVNVITTLPIVVLKDSKNPSLVKAWVDYVVAHHDELVGKYGFLSL